VAYTTPTSDDLALYLGNSNIDAERAALLIAQAESLARAILTTLPDAATAVILSAAARGYASPQGVTSEMTGPYSVQRPPGGVYLTKLERAALRRLSGGGGAFSIDPTPATAGPGNLWAQQPETVAETVISPPFYGDYDQIP
jgi:hypothetical protein